MKCSEKTLHITRSIRQIILILIVVASFYIMVKTDVNRLPIASTINICLDELGLVITTILYYSNIRSRQDNDRPQGVFLLLLFWEAIELFTDMIAWVVQGVPTLRLVNLWDNVLFYVGGNVVVFLFWHYVRAISDMEKRWDRIVNPLMHLILIIGTVTTVLNVFFGYYFTVDKMGVYRRTEITFLVSNIPSLIMMLVEVLLIITVKIDRGEKRILLLYVAAPVIAQIIQIFTFGLSMLYIVILCMLITIYCNIQVKRAKELVLSKSALLSGQIKPHFMQNCLSTISGLCHNDTDKAVEFITQLSGYLRSSFVLMESDECIPFEKELELIRFYIKIQQTRFVGCIEVEENIQVKDFNVPSLTLEPLVENAIRHGIQGLGRTGHILIETSETENAYIIVIQDDGGGFNVEMVRRKIMERNNGHVGLKNVERRLMLMARGSFGIESKIGVGTKVTVTIPK